MKVNITAIKRFAVHDGDGIRTTVFFKGCPLKCIWCHNPETQSPRSELAFYRHKCVLCRRCENLCNCHSFFENIHTVDRSKCTMCKKCIKVCPQNAFEIFGIEKSADEICSILLKDKDFYSESGGGITLSGGECLLQSEACSEILKNMKREGINTAADTCGYVSKSAIDDVMPYTDLFLYDIKAIDEDIHIKYTGCSNKIILDNLVYLDRCGAKTEVRIPYVPGCNGNEIEKIALFLSKLNNLTGVKVLPYHNLAASKYDALDMENTLPDKLVCSGDIKKAETMLENFRLNIKR